MGNLGSIVNMIKKIGSSSTVSSRISDVENADKLILPGVGAFDHGITHLNELGLIPALSKKVKQLKTPILGICLGMQLFTLKSEEGRLPGLGWLEAETIKFNLKDPKLKIPHMGWNDVSYNPESKLFGGLGENPRFYFVHSYHVVCKDKSDECATTIYEKPFTSSVQKENICGVQFHPEKSHRFGLQLLKNFIEKS